MKRFKFLGKLMYLANWLAVILLLICFVVPYMSPSSFPYFNLLSLAVSPLMLLNLIFAIYWISRGKRRAVPSILILILCFWFFKPIVWNTSRHAQDKQKQLSVMSFNVRLFNAYEEEPDVDGVRARFAQLLETHDPDVLCIQEYYKPNPVDLSRYPYRFVHYKDTSNALGHAIYSKFPLIQSHGFDFEETYNNTIYSDLVVGRDTLRVYNFHLQSVGIQSRLDFFRERSADRIGNHLSTAFIKQQKQAASILEHREQSPYPVILAGDLNNSAFGNIYQKMSEDLQDTFLEAGSGIGGTYIFGFYPLRIDFILTDPKFEVTEYQTLDRTFSDHKPVLAKIQWD